MSRNTSGGGTATAPDIISASGTTTAAIMPSASVPTADQLAARWTELWNGSFGLAEDLCTADFRVHFAAKSTDTEEPHPGDNVRGPAQFVDFLHDFHATHPAIRFALDGASAGEVNSDGTGVFAARWYVDIPGGPSGIDMFDIREGKIAEVWSVTGTRRFPTT